MEPKTNFWTSVERNGLVKWVQDQKRVTFNGITTFRDAHQSLLATRYSYKRFTSKLRSQQRECLPNLFQRKCGASATFDVAYRFLKKIHGKRLLDLREKCRTCYSKCYFVLQTQWITKTIQIILIQKFVECSAQQHWCISVFYDSLNWWKHEIAMTLYETLVKICRSKQCAYTGIFLTTA